MADARRLPFHCGTQGADWDARNCDQCRKRWREEEGDVWPCDIQKAVFLAYWDDGTVSADIAKRMGLPKDGLVYNWDCTEKRAEGDFEELGTPLFGD